MRDQIYGYCLDSCCGDAELVPLNTTIDGGGGSGIGGMLLDRERYHHVSTLSATGGLKELVRSSPPVSSSHDLRIIIP